MSVEQGIRADLIVARFGEIWLKGKNRHYFEKALVRNVKAALHDVPGIEVRRDHGQLVIRAPRRTAEAVRRMGDVFGFSSISPARAVAPTPDAIVRACIAAMDDALLNVPHGEPIPWRIDVRRSDKRFAMVSTELEHYIAERLDPSLYDRLRVDLSNPELTLGVNVRHDHAYVFAERLPGAGGLPVGTLGRAICLLSGGIDSPVAAWMAMKRGCEVAFLSFHSYPYLGDSSKRKVERLVRALSRFQPRNRLYVAPFTEVQTAIRDSAPEPYRTVLYRRQMARIANRIAVREKAGVLITGECLGQVASQTMENLTCIGAASERPVLRPLIAFDKSETIELARRIGTYEVSIQPEPDCCTVFQPTRPVIRGTLAACDEAEAALDLEGLIDRAAGGVEIIDVRDV